MSEVADVCSRSFKLVEVCWGDLCVDLAVLYKNVVFGDCLGGFKLNIYMCVLSTGALLR